MSSVWSIFAKDLQLFSGLFLPMTGLFSSLGWQMREQPGEKKIMSIVVHTMHRHCWSSLLHLGHAGVKFGIL